MRIFVVVRGRGVGASTSDVPAKLSTAVKRHVRSHCVFSNSFREDLVVQHPTEGSGRRNLQNQDLHVVVRQAIACGVQHEPSRADHARAFQHGRPIGQEKWLNRLAFVFHDGRVGCIGHPRGRCWPIESHRGVRIIHELREARQEGWVDSRGIPRAVEGAIVNPSRSVDHHVLVDVAIHRTHAVGRGQHVHVEAVGRQSSLGGRERFNGHGVFCAWLLARAEIARPIVF